MDKTMDLAEQHIRESASRLRYIDELMARARVDRPSDPTVAHSEARFRQLESDRHRLALKLRSLQRSPAGTQPDFDHQALGLTGLLASLGLQLEQLLAAVLKSQT